MKKKYIVPQIKVMKIEMEDIVRTRYDPDNDETEIISYSFSE